MSEEKSVEVIVKETIKETIEESMSNRSIGFPLTPNMTDHQSFNVTKIDNGFLLNENLVEEIVVGEQK